MKVIETKENIVGLKKGSVLTIGNFDGVHLGHKKILDTAKNIAKEKNSELVAITFHPHPVTILHPEKSPGVLTPLHLKKHLLEKAGVDQLVILKDSYDLLNLSPQAFIQEFLMKQVHPAIVVEGENFNFGYGRSGNIDTLKELGKKCGFQVVVVSPKTMQLSDNRIERISSTLIRHLLQKAKVTDVANAQERNYRLIGQTIKGRGIGMELGFPTANINPVEQIVPDEGVYAGRVEIEDSLENVCTASQQLPAIFSIGRAKTFITDHPTLVEAHLLTNEEVGDLYGKWLAMDFVKFIRHQERFDSPENLAKQIAEDCKLAWNILQKADI